MHPRIEFDDAFALTDNAWAPSSSFASEREGAWIRRPESCAGVLAEASHPQGPTATPRATSASRAGARTDVADRSHPGAGMRSIMSWKAMACSATVRSTGAGPRRHRHLPGGRGPHQVTAITRMVLYRVQAGADRHPESLDALAGLALAEAGQGCAFTIHCCAAAVAPAGSALIVAETKCDASFSAILPSGASVTTATFLMCLW